MKTSNGGLKVIVLHHAADSIVVIFAPAPVDVPAYVQERSGASDPGEAVGLFAGVEVALYVK